MVSALARMTLTGPCTTQGQRQTSAIVLAWRWPIRRAAPWPPTLPAAVPCEPGMSTGPHEPPARGRCRFEIPGAPVIYNGVAPVDKGRFRDQQSGQAGGASAQGPAAARAGRDNRRQLESLGVRPTIPTATASHAAALSGGCP